MTPLKPLSSWVQNTLTVRVSDIVVDEQHRVVTTPAYMLAGSLSEAASGIDKLVAKVLSLATTD